MNLFLYLQKNRGGGILCLSLLLLIAFWAPPQQARAESWGRPYIESPAVVVMAPIFAVLDFFFCTGFWGSCKKCSGSMNALCYAQNDCDPPLVGTGRIQCNGSCSAVPPPVAYCAAPEPGDATSTNSNGTGNGDNGNGNASGDNRSVVNFGVTNPNTNGTSSPFYASPNIVDPGAATTLFWGNGINHATKCTVSGGGISYTAGKTGSTTTKPITEDTIFTLDCQNGTGPGTGAHAALLRTRVHMNPKYQEI